MYNVLWCDPTLYFGHYLSCPTPFELPASLVALSINVKSLTIMSCGGLEGALTTILEANHRRFSARVFLDTDTQRDVALYALKRRKNFR